MRLLSALAVGLLLPAFPAQAQQAGWLISASMMADAPKGAQGWRIRYMSTDDRGQPEEVTGVVIAPLGPAPKLGRKVIAWAHGTWGVAGKCAPQTDRKLFEVTPGLNEMLARGYAIVATDYAGLGTPQPHPYLVGASAAHNMLDAIRASRTIAEVGIGTRFIPWGESQGGHASLFTGELARSYAPELSIVGVAAAAPPTDLLENLTGGSDPSIRAFLTAFTADSWSRHFDIPLTTLGSKSTGTLINRLAQNCISLGKTPKLGTIIGVAVLRARLKGVDLGKIEPWARIARDNSVSTQPYGVPFFIAQNTKDAIVSPAVTKDWVRKICSKGGQVRYLAITSKGGHPTSAADSSRAFLDWADARFAGNTVPNDCDSV